MKFFLRKVSLEDKILEEIINEIITKINLLADLKKFSYIILEPLDKEPDIKYNGMVVYFNNVNGKTGFYGYENGNWIKL